LGISFDFAGFGAIWAGSADAGGNLSDFGAAGRFCAGSVSVLSEDLGARCDAIYAKARVHAKKILAKTAVERLKKLADPLAPKRLPDDPAPKPVPMSAPLPC
jgi:hypothetical protein